MRVEAVHSSSLSTAEFILPRARRSWFTLCKYLRDPPVICEQFPFPCLLCSIGSGIRFQWAVEDFFTPLQLQVIRRPRKIEKTDRAETEKNIWAGVAQILLKYQILGFALWTKSNFVINLFFHRTQRIWETRGFSRWNAIWRAAGCVLDTGSAEPNDEFIFHRPDVLLTQAIKAMKSWCQQATQNDRINFRSKFQLISFAYRWRNVDLAADHSNLIGLEKHQVFCALLTYIMWLKMRRFKKQPVRKQLRMRESLRGASSCLWVLCVENLHAHAQRDENICRTFFSHNSTCRMFREDEFTCVNPMADWRSVQLAFVGRRSESRLSVGRQQKPKRCRFYLSIARHVRHEAHFGVLSRRAGFPEKVDSTHRSCRLTDTSTCRGRWSDNSNHYFN